MSFQLITDHPIASDSRDHIVPGGTMMDNTNHPEFLQKMYDLFPGRPFALMDMGCSSGHMVEQVLKDRVDIGRYQNNRVAVGLEGSDYSLARQRGAWSRIPDNLFVCDISQPFKVVSRYVAEKMRDQVTYRSLKPFVPQYGDGINIKLFDGMNSHLTHHKETPAFRFDVITCWEVMEHIPEDRLSQLIDNVLEHLMPDGIWAMSISSQQGYHHRTLRERPWWLELFESRGLFNDHKVTSVIGRDWPRGPNEPDSFNLALRRKIQEPEV